MLFFFSFSRRGPGAGEGVASADNNASRYRNSVFLEQMFAFELVKIHKALIQTDENRFKLITHEGTRTLMRLCATWSPCRETTRPPSPDALTNREHLPQTAARSCDRRSEERRVGK